MRAVVQRVSRAAVTVAGRETGRIGPGLVILLGVEDGDTEADRAWLLRKTAGLRIFPDAAGRLNRSLTECDGEALVVSQFTLLASCRKGNRPSFTRAAQPDPAEAAYLAFVRELGQYLGRPVPTGKFAAEMAVELCNDGPVTIVLDSRLQE